MENIKRIKEKLEGYVLEFDLNNSTTCGYLAINDAVELILKLDAVIANHQASQEFYEH